MYEYAIQEGPADGDPQALSAALNSMAANGFELDFVYDRSYDLPPLLVYTRELDDVVDAVIYDEVEE